jgi:ActR/RegA family two-component response regulator
VVDLRLGDESALSVCRRLALRDLPFVIHTGYDADAVRLEWPSTTIIQKPAMPGAIRNALSDCFRSDGDMVQPISPSVGRTAVECAVPR